MNKRLIDTGLKSFAEVIRKRLPRCSVRITRKAMGQCERLLVVFPLPDKNKQRHMTMAARMNTGTTPTGYIHKIEIIAPTSSTARLEIASTPTGYTYQVWLETPARDLELANPGVYTELEGICDALYKLAKRDPHWPKPSPATAPLIV